MAATYEDVISFHKANIEATVAASAKLFSGIEELSKEYIGFVSKSVEDAVAQAKTVAAVKTPAEALQLQQSFAKASYESAVAEATKLAELTKTIAGSVGEPLQSRAKAAYESLSKAS